MTLNHARQGSGPPLLLIHGLGGSRHSFDVILDDLTAQREVITVDLPGFGDTPELTGEATIPAYADALADFLTAEDLLGVDVVGSSMGARLTLELARRGGLVGQVVALDPGGFWSSGQKRAFNISVGASAGLLKLVRPALPFLTGNPVTRTLLLAQFSARPWKLPRGTVLPELESFATAPGVRPALRGLVDGPEQQGAPAGTLDAPVLIVWGRQDKVTLPSQATRAQELFPDAKIHFIDKCGHFPHWDQPQQTVQLILGHTG